jgi:hypothetical protein
MKLFSFVFFALLLIPLSASAQNTLEACATNHNAPPVGAYYWPPDSDIKVYLVRDMFTPEQRRTLFEAMETWNTSAQQTGAGVKFTYAGETDGLINCQSCLTITRREVYKNDRKHYAFFNPLKQYEDGLLFSAWIDFDVATSDPKALEGFMVHELGHGMGLWDCKSCKKKQTIMNAFPGVNHGNGLVAPSACDLEVVKQIYSLHRRLPRDIADSAVVKQRR